MAWSCRGKMWIPVSHTAQYLGCYFFFCSSMISPPISTAGQESDSLLMTASSTGRSTPSRTRSSSNWIQTPFNHGAWHGEWNSTLQSVTSWELDKVWRGHWIASTNCQRHGEILTEVSTAKCQLSLLVDQGWGQFRYFQFQFQFHYSQ